MARKRQDVPHVNRAQSQLLTRGIGGPALAAATRTTPAAVQRWLDGSGLPKPELRDLIAKVYDIPAAHWLLSAPTIEERLGELAEKPQRPPATVGEEARRRWSEPITIKEASAVLAVILRDVSAKVSEALGAVSERDLVYCHAGYRTMRETLLRLLAADPHFYGEACAILPEPPADGPVAALRAARQELEALETRARERSTHAVSGSDFGGAAMLDKQTARVTALLRRARLDASNIEKLFTGDVWSRLVRELSALLREDPEALEMAREWLEPAEDVFSRRMHAELKQVRHVTWPCVEFQDDPDRFVRQILGQDPWVKQSEMMQRIRDNPRFACRSGHRVGKSYSIAWIMLWLYSCWPNARVFFTNSTERQVDAVNWVEVRRAIAGSGVCLECKRKNKTLKAAEQVMAPCPHSAKIEGKCSDRAKGGLHSDDFREITGFTAKDAESTAGLAGENIFFIVDEASGVAQQIFIALEGNRAGGAKLALFGNPTRNEGEFYEAFYSKSKVYGEGLMTIASTESPNVVQGREVIKGLATREWCEEMAEIWGKDDPLYKMRVLGVHVIGEDGRLIPLSVIADAHERWLSETAEGQLYIGLDVAGPEGSGDESVFAPRRGQKIIELRARRGLDDDAHLAELLEIIAVHGKKGEVAIVNVDSDGGIGAGLVGRLRQYEATNPGVLKVYAIRGSSNALRQPRIYDRLRDEVGANFAFWIRHGGAIPHDPKLEKELHVLELKVKLLPTKGERTKLIAKDILKKLLGRSPDRFDACALAAWDQELGSDDVGEGAPEEEAADMREEGGQLDAFAGRDAFDPYA